MTALERRRRILALGERALEYYRDTGLCVFCSADDVEELEHDPDCDVGALSGVELTHERAEDKARQRRAIDAWIARQRLRPVDGDGG